MFVYKHPILTSNLDSTHSFLTFYRINIGWGLKYDGFMTIYGLHINREDVKGIIAGSHISWVMYLHKSVHGHETIKIKSPFNVNTIKSWE